ncbi:MAG: LysM peptidoglycan-binding domain-containing protein [Phycisphaerales bacterium]
MTRENKLALIIGFSLILVVAILITDHLSPAQNGQVADLRPTTAMQASSLPAGGSLVDPRAIADRHGGTGVRRESRREPDAPIINLHPSTTALQVETIEPRNEEAPAAIEMTTEPLTTAPPAGVFQHVVRRHDTLYSIARQHYGDGKLWDRLAQYNRDRLPDDLKLTPGLALLVPSKEALGVSAPAPTPVVPNANPKPAPAREYTIQRGDTLSEISLELLGTSKRWREIYELNRGRIKDPGNVPAGVTIQIPAR